MEKSQNYLSIFCKIWEVKINCYEIVRTPFLTQLMRFVSMLGDGWVPFFLTPLSAFLIAKKDKKIAWLLFVATSLSIIIKEYLKNLVQSDRPEVYGCEVLTKFTGGYSFPSGHVIYYLVFGGIIIYFAWLYRTEAPFRYLIVVALLFILMIGYSRYYLGAHWVSDIVGGYILGLLFLFLSLKFYYYFLRKSGYFLYDKNGYVQTAGAIVVRDDSKGKKEVLLVYRERQKDYTFPKGAILPAESIERAVQREVLEETGYQIKLLRRLPQLKYKKLSDGKKVKVYLFFARVIKRKLKKEKREWPVWVKFNQVEKTLTYQNLKEYWRRIKYRINNERYFDIQKD